VVIIRVAPKVVIPSLEARQVNVAVVCYEL
jgi:hypothetical protein